MQSNHLIEAGVGLVLFIYVVSAMVPSALTSIMNVNSTSGYSHWGSSILSLWGVMGIFVVITIVMLVYSFVKMR